MNLTNFLLAGNDLRMYICNSVEVVHKPNTYIPFALPNFIYIQLYHIVHFEKHSFSFSTVRM